MKAKEIEQGKTYLARVSGKVVRVRVDAIREVNGIGSRSHCLEKRYDVTNLKTGRRTVFRSAAKFLRSALQVNQGALQWDGEAGAS